MNPSTADISGKPEICTSARNRFLFTCQQCGRCCSKNQEGYIFLYKEDLRKIGNFLSISLEEMAEKFLDIIRFRFEIYGDNLVSPEIEKVLPAIVLKSEKKKDCIFLQKKLGKKQCKIYPVRPIQCELFPYWNIVFTSDEFFQATVQNCPGCNVSETESDPHIVNEDFINQHLQQERRIERDYYLHLKKYDFDFYEAFPFMLSCPKKLKESKGTLVFEF